MHLGLAFPIGPHRAYDNRTSMDGHCHGLRRCRIDNKSSGTELRKSPAHRGCGLPGRRRLPSTADAMRPTS